MIHPRHALLPLIGLCALLSACSDKADKLSDGDLARMLHTEGLADERIDAAAVDCLRAWSDDSNLAAGLPANLTDEAGKGDCRRHMQGWLDDGSRNPQGLMFVDVSTPKVSRRAMDLLAALPPLEAAPAVAESSVPTMPPDSSMLPPAQADGAGVSPEVAEAAYEERVKVNNSTNQAMDQYDSVCEEAQNLAKTRQFDAGTLQRISRCKQTSAKLRQRMEGVIARGTAFDVSMATRGAEQELQLLRDLIAKKNN